MSSGRHNGKRHDADRNQDRERNVLVEFPNQLFSNTVKHRLRLGFVGQRENQKQKAEQQACNDGKSGQDRDEQGIRSTSFTPSVFVATAIARRVGRSLSVICLIVIRGCVLWWRSCCGTGLLIISRV